jgi:hypothetical protein
MLGGDGTNIMCQVGHFWIVSANDGRLWIICQGV